MDNDLLYRIAFDYINERVTMQTLADRYSLSKISVIRYLSGSNKTYFLDKATQEAVDITKSKRALERSVSGEVSRPRKPRAKLIPPEKARELANYMIENELTIADLVTDTGPSAGTLYGALNEVNLGPELYARLQEHYKRNRSNATRNCHQNSGKAK